MKQERVLTLNARCQASKPDVDAKAGAAKTLNTPSPNPRRVISMTVPNAKTNAPKPNGFGALRNVLLREADLESVARPWPVFIGQAIYAFKAMRAKEIALRLDHIRGRAAGPHHIKPSQT